MTQLFVIATSVRTVAPDLLRLVVVGLLVAGLLALSIARAAGRSAASADGALAASRLEVWDGMGAEVEASVFPERAS